MRVGVLGAAGRMGATVCRAVAGEADLELVAAVDPGRAGASLGEVIGEDRGADLILAEGAEELARRGAEVAVDFTFADAARENAVWCARNGVHAVIGTSGLTDEDLRTIDRMSVAGGVGCILAPNFAIGAVLMEHFAVLAAPFVDGAEIVELHHDGKIDAPSGTAIHLAEAIAAARAASGAGAWAKDPTERFTVPGTRGARVPSTAAEGVAIHSVRSRGLVAHHEVLLGAPGQSLTIRHDSYDRSSFMPGVLLAVRSVSSRRGLTVGLGALLGI